MNVFYLRLMRWRLQLARHPHSSIQPNHNPFNIEFSNPSLTILANSSGFPALSGNSITLVRLPLTLSDIIAVIPLSNELGAIVTTLIPYFARSRVKGSVSEAIAPFDADRRTWQSWKPGLLPPFPVWPGCLNGRQMWQNLPYKIS